jgi:integrase
MADAKTFEAALIRRRAMGAFAPNEPSPITVESAAAEWLALGKETWAGTTTKKRTSQINHWITPMIGDVRLRDLSRARAKQMRVDMLSAGASRKHVNEVMKTLSALFANATEDELIPSNPIAGIKGLSVMPNERRVPSDQEVDAVINKMPTDVDRAIVLLLAGTGMRPAELCGLKWRDVDDDVIHVVRSVQSGFEVPPKNLKGRRVPIGSTARRGLAVAPHGQPSNYIVTNSARPLAWELWFKRVWKKSGADFIPYQLRHRRASVLLSRGVPPPAVADQLGHTLAILFARYAHLMG